MTIQALVNLRILSADYTESVIEVRAGDTVNLPPERVYTLLAKIPDKIRVIRPGFLVTWESPLFGVCEGRICEVVADKVVISEHGVTKKRATIPVSWITQVEREELTPCSLARSKKTRRDCL